MSKELKSKKKRKKRKVVYPPKVKPELVNGGKPEVFHASLLLLCQDGKVFLAMKRAKIGKGCYNSCGGDIKITRGETPEQSAVREAREEFGVRVSVRDLRKVGVETFYTHNDDGTIFTCYVHVFRTGVWRGEPTNKEPKKMGPPKQFLVSRLPGKLMAADNLWLRLALAEVKHRGVFHYDHGQRNLIKEVRIEFTNDLDVPLV